MTHLINDQTKLTGEYLFSYSHGQPVIRNLLINGIPLVNRTVYKFQGLMFVDHPDKSHHNKTVVSYFS